MSQSLKCFLLVAATLAPLIEAQAFNWEKVGSLRLKAIFG
jgi:hypothetical protein